MHAISPAVHAADGVHPLPTHLLPAGQSSGGPHSSQPYELASHCLKCVSSAHFVPPVQTGGSGHWTGAHVPLMQGSVVSQQSELVLHEPPFGAHAHVFLVGFVASEATQLLEQQSSGFVQSFPASTGKQPEH